MGFSRQECWSGLPFPSAGDLPDPGIKPGSPALQADALPSEPSGKPWCIKTLLVYKNNRFWVLILYPEALLNSLIVSNNFFYEVFRFSTYMSSANSDSFSFSLPIWMPFISFTCLIALARTSHTMLNKSGKSGYLCLVPDLRGKVWFFKAHLWQLYTPYEDVLHRTESPQENESHNLWSTHSTLRNVLKCIL